MRSSAFHSHAVTSDVTWARRLPCVVTTPLGLPVVPLVYRIMARRSSGTSGSEERGSAASAPTVRSWRTVDAAGTASSRGASSASATTTATSASRITYSSSGGGCDVARGTATPPARQIPHCVAT